MLVKKDPAIFILSFIEGAAVMAIEIIAAKLIAPSYGNSIYVWTAVLGTTLGGLAIGYFLGGQLSTKPNTRNLVHLIALICGLLIILMPWTSSIDFGASLNLDLRLEITIFCMLLLWPPLVLCGMVSPMIIKIIATKTGEIGPSAGTVYAISTVGGIIATFLASFYFIPYQGLIASSIYMGSLLALVSVLHFAAQMLRKKKVKS